MSGRMVLESSRFHYATRNEYIFTNLRLFISGNLFNGFELQCTVCNEIRGRKTISKKGLLYIMALKKSRDPVDEGLGKPPG